MTELRDEYRVYPIGVVRNAMEVERRNVCTEGTRGGSLYGCVIVTETVRGGEIGDAPVWFSGWGRSPNYGFSRAGEVLAEMRA